jgi:hypothetical protein
LQAKNVPAYYSQVRQKSFTGLSMGGLSCQLNVAVTAFKTYQSAYLQKNHTNYEPLGAK